VVGAAKGMTGKATDGGGDIGTGGSPGRALWLLAEELESGGVLLDAAALEGTASGAASRGGACAGGSGAFAKSRGGVVGAARGVSGKDAGDRAGLHGSCGGTQRGATAGGMSCRNGRRSEDENSRGDRPDYLVENEENWISEETGTATYS
jgi:hypothetical protein